MGGAYVYLLGLYLGDGMASAYPRGVWRLRISLDLQYPQIIRACKAAIEEVAARTAGDQPYTYARCTEIYCYWKHWPCVFPQLGPGLKHTRRIELEDWQRRLVELYPRELLRGLIHSDGCRCINRVKGYEYPRYFFSNRSDDIRAIFVRACELVGADSRPDGPYRISVARATSVELLDGFIGPKS